MVAGLWGQRALRVDLVARRVVWDVSLASTVPVVAAEAKAPPSPPDAPAAPPQLNENVLPYAVAWDGRHHRVFVSLWGASEIDVLNDRDGAILARWPAGDRPGELLLSPDRRLFAVNSIRNLAWNIGWTVGPYVSGLVQQRWGFTPLFINTAVMYGIGITLTWIFFHPRAAPDPAIAPV